MSTGRKYEAIDLLPLAIKGSANGWNEHLEKCLLSGNINALAKTRYQIQAGMDDLTKVGHNTEEMIKLFCRWDKSLVDTAKKIIRKRHPLPHDVIIHGDNKERPKTALEAKRRRDQELETFLRESSY